MTDERIISLMSKEKPIEEFVFTNKEAFLSIIQDISRNPTSKIARRAAGVLQDIERKKMLGQQVAAQQIGSKPFEATFNAAATLNYYTNKFHALSVINLKIATTADRLTFYQDVASSMPEQVDLADATMNRNVFGYLKHIAVTSHAATVNEKMPSLILLMNHMLKKDPSLKGTVSKHIKEYLLTKFPKIWLD